MLQLSRSSSRALLNQSFISVFQDVNVMIFVGFGFLMTFLKHYGYGATGLTLLSSAYAVQTSILIRGVLNLDDDGFIGVDVSK